MAPFSFKASRRPAWLAFCLILLSTVFPGGAFARDRITVVMSGWDMQFWATLAAKELGLFEAEGIDAEMVRTGGGAKSLAAVAAGEAQFNIGAPTSAFRARAKGSDVMMIAPAIAQYNDNVIMSDAWAKGHGLTDTSSYADKLKALKGMTLAVPSVGAGSDQLVRFLAKQAGLDPDRDLTITAVGTADAMIPALVRGRVDGFVIPSPVGEDAIQNHGAHFMFHTVAGEVKALDGFIYIGVIARESWLKQNAGLAVRFLRAEQRGLDAMHDPATTNKARDLVHAAYFPRMDKPFFDLIWKASEPSFPRTVALDKAMVDRIVAFVNDTLPDQLDAATVAKAWTNDYAAQALAGR